MNARNKFISLSLGLTLFAGSFSQKAFAWGALGHSLIAEIAAETSTAGHSFWSSNSKTLGQLANVPDVVWKQDATINAERPTHWFQIDAYVEDPATYPQALRSFIAAVARYQLPFVTKNGTATWRVEQMYEMALDALKQNNDERAIQIVGALAHYIGDISQPLHVTRNYDGPNGTKNGIHRFFETENLDSIDKDTLINQVMQETRQLKTTTDLDKSFSTDVLEGTFAAVVRSARNTQSIFDIDSQHGRNAAGSEKMLTVAKLRLADGSASLSAVLTKLWTESKRSDVANKLNVRPPEFIPVKYTSAQGSQESIQQDCN